MKNVRVWYRKDGACRFISHLDINRTVMRALQMSGIPLWHTEGFNSRLYVSFALPLSLGFRGMYESVDIRLMKNEYPFGLVIEKLNACLPLGLIAYDVTEPVMKAGDIRYAHFKIIITAEEHSPSEIYFNANSILAKEKILVEKKNKKGVIKQENLKESIVEYTLDSAEKGIRLEITLPAGNEKNVNPALLIDAIEKECGFELFSDISRTALYNKSFELFK